MTCQSLLGVGEGDAVGLAEALADDFDEDLGEDLDDDFDFAKEMEPRQRQRMPAIRKERNRGAFINNRGAGWVPYGYRIWRWRRPEGAAFKLIETAGGSSRQD